MKLCPFVIAALLSTPAAAVAGNKCPAAVSDAAKQAIPDATITKCVEKKSHFEVKMQRKDKSIVELELSAAGDVEEIEEVIQVSAIPAAVTKAFAAKYPKMTISKAEKQTRADKTVRYEVAFKTNKGLAEATFEANGKFVEEE